MTFLNNEVRIYGFFNMYFGSFYLSYTLNRKPHFSNSKIKMGFCLEIGANDQAFRYYPARKIRKV